MVFVKSYRFVFILFLVFVATVSSQRLLNSKAYGIEGTVGSTETKDISVSGSETTFSSIVNGATYEIVISGTFKLNADSASNPMNADAQWVAPNCTSCSYTQHNNVIGFNGVQKASDNYKTQASPNHTYTWTWIATTTSLKLKIVDSNYSDNTGGPLSAKVTLTALPGNPPPPTSGGTKLSFDLLMHGIGKAGDSQNPGEMGGGNMNPNNIQRTIFINVLDLNNQVVVPDKQGTVVFTSDSGSFKTQPGGEVDLGNLAAGPYIIKVKMPQSLTKSIPKNIIVGTVNTLAQTPIITGDANNDNHVNFDDYTILEGCVSEFETAADCDADKKAKADLNDDGSVNLPDLTLFLREVSNRVGE